MFYCNKIDLSEGIDRVKCKNNNECVVYHSLILIDWFEFQNSLCNVCHDLTIFCLNISDIAIIAIKNVVYCHIIHCVSKSEAIHLFQISWPEDC